MKTTLFTVVLVVVWVCWAWARTSDTFIATAYCSCYKCCGKSDGIMANGYKAHRGAVACNWLPFGTKLLVDGKQYVVADRGAKSLFGSKSNHIKRLDIWMPSHKEALRWGCQKVEVVVL